jgi:PAS domain S-box-containing protein
MSEADGADSAPNRPDARLTVDADIDSIPDAVVIANPATGRVVDANAAAGELFRCQPDDLVGRHQTELHPADGGDYMEAFQRGVDGERVNRLANGQPVYIDTDDGRRIPVEINVEQLDTRDGMRVLGVFRDVSEQVERERALETATSRLETLLDALPVPVAMLDTDGVVKRWNAAAETTFGYAAESIVGEPHPLFLDETEFERILDRMTNNETITGYETTFRASDGSRIPVELYGQPVYENGTLSGIVGAAIDISGRQQRERHVDTLHRVLRHNLRNELTVIQGWANHLGNEQTDQSKAVEKIGAAGDRLLSLTEEVKHIRTGLSNERPQDGAQTVEELTARLSEQVAQQDATTLTVGEMPSAGTIPQYGGQAVSLLFDSILSHVDGTEITITVDTQERYLLLRIAGETPLLSTAERSLIETGEETALNHSTGLQINRADLIVESLGGNVTTESGPTDTPASSLTVELPRADRPAESVDR